MEIAADAQKKNVIVMDLALNKDLNLSFDEIELQMRAYAQEHKVPIIQDAGLAFLEMILRLYQPHTILEIGTAIGYSAIRMAHTIPASIVTIERNEEMVEQALKNIHLAKLDNRIKLIFKDALECFADLKNQKFDLIFIDAAKAQYLNFFELFTPLLTEHGVVVCDNMSFHGLVLDPECYSKQSRSVRGLIRKLNHFKENLLQNPKFDTSIFNIGDGMAVSVRKG